MGQNYGLLQSGPVSRQDLTLKTQLEAVNGKKMPALEVFAHALRFFKEHALQVRSAPPPGPPFPLSPSLATVGGQRSSSPLPCLLVWHVP